MIRVEIEPDETAEHNYVLRVRDGNNGNILLSSTTQGYENVGFVQTLARRLFPPTPAPFDNNGDDMEPVIMVTRFRNTPGTHTEQLR